HGRGRHGAARSGAGAARGRGVAAGRGGAGRGGREEPRRRREAAKALRERAGLGGFRRGRALGGPLEPLGREPQRGPPTLATRLAISIAAMAASAPLLP